MELDEKPATKRKRSKNYTPQEEWVLLKLVQKHIDILENKKADAATWKHKEETWRLISKIYAAKTRAPRNFRSLKDKFDFWKRKSKPYSQVGNDEIPPPICERIKMMLRDANGPNKIFEQDSDISCEIEETFSNEPELEEHNSTEHEVDENSLIEQILFSESDQMPGEKLLKNEDDSHIQEPYTYNPIIDKNKRSKSKLETEKIQLTLQQQKFYKDANARAQEKHELELISMKLKNDLLQLEAKKIKVELEKKIEMEEQRMQMEEHRMKMDEQRIKNEFQLKKMELEQKERFFKYEISFNNAKK